ncbi:MAG: glycoside hydrolase family 88 protein [Clostridia bacterium]|nr:glycoside hydrolase family 88 protein [Clostridia bacterium]
MTEKVKRALLAMQRYNWEQGVAAQAFLEAGDQDIAIAMAVEGANRQHTDGRCCHIGDSPAVTDPCAIGEALIFACEQTGDPALCAARDKLLHWALHAAPRSPQGTVYHFLEGKLIWVDSMYMLPPFLARAGHFDEAVRQLDGYWQVLFNPENSLLSHQWSDETHTFPRKAAWAVGNGWAMAGMARVIALLPQTHAEARNRMIQRVKTLLDAALPYQMADGSFHDVLDDPSTFREVNFSQMLAYAVYRGVAGGWLDASYLPAAELARSAALSEVDAFGLVRNVCGMPFFDRPGVAPEGQTFHILMEAARAKL